jgi:hypothetical protein
MPIEFRSEADLYAARPDAKEAKELEFGSGWRGKHGSSYRLSWNKGTHQLWAVASPSGRVIVLGDIPTRKETERLLDGWQDWCDVGAPFGDIEWLVDRLGNRLVPDDPKSGPVNF